FFRRTQKNMLTGEYLPLIQYGALPAKFLRVIRPRAASAGQRHFANEYRVWASHTAAAGRVFSLSAIPVRRPEFPARRAVPAGAPSPGRTCPRRGAVDLFTCLRGCFLHEACSSFSFPRSCQPARAVVASPTGGVGTTVTAGRRPHVRPADRRGLR